MKCPLCGHEGHGAETCNSANGIAARGGRGVPMRYGRRKVARKRSDERQAQRIADILAEIRKPRKRRRK